MAELVQFNTESMVSELRKLKNYEVFNEDEIRTIVEKRKEFEYKLQRHCRRQEDALKYIQYETDLLNLVIIRSEELALDKSKKAQLKNSLKGRIRNLFLTTLRRNSADVKLWLSYLNFCKKFRMYTSASNAIERMMRFHSDKPSLFKISALWEYEECSSVEKARKYFLDGLHLHPKSKILLLEAFKMELNFTDTKRKEMLVEEVTDESDPLLTGKLAEIFYEEALNKVSDPDFIAEFWLVLSEYPFASCLKDKILRDLTEKYPKSEMTWDCLAKKELDVEEEDIEVVDRIENVIKKYEEAVLIVNTEKMWEKFLEGTLNILRTYNLSSTKRKLFLTRAFVRAHNEAKLKENHYMLWVEHLQGSEDLLQSVLTKGCQQLKHSLGLWKSCVKYHLGKNQNEAAEEVFRDAIKTLKDSSSLWKLIIDHFTRSNPDKAQKLYEEGTTQASGSFLRPRFIAWLSQHKTLESAREFYRKYKTFPPFSKELHFKMIQAETKAENVSAPVVRNCFQNLIYQFGSDHADIWLKFINFEEKFGDPSTIPNIYSRALTTLKNSATVDEFTSLYNLRKVAGAPSDDSESEEEEELIVNKEDELTWAVDRSAEGN